ncbi:MAG: beta-N-acetylhexosaminidase [Acetobacteraceae bacterium]
MKAAVIGISGPALLPGEAELLEAHPPAGVILFARNILTRSQLAALAAALRRHLAPEAVLMVDQEGGRVARLRPPAWHAHPPAAAIGAVFARDPAAGERLAWLHGALIGRQCAEAGFEVVTAPVLDLAVAGANAVVGDRAFAAEPAAVALLGGAMAAGLLAAGVQPVAKHAPGHGRAGTDSHLGLPVIAAADLAADIAPFAANAALPWMMTAHCLYPALDPDLPATLSAAIIGAVIRGRIGFAGVLLSDDLGMGALSGPIAERAVAALAAGCDLALHCAGDEETARVLAAVPALGAESRARLARARALAAERREVLDSAALTRERDRLLA